MTSPKKPIYRVIYLDRESTYELYARDIEMEPSDFFGFIMLKNMIFSQPGAIVLNPEEEFLKNEFKDVESTLIPAHSIIRIDWVKTGGISRAKPLRKTGNVSQFPGQYYSPCDVDRESDK